MILENIWRWVVDNDLINFSPSNIFQLRFCLQDFIKIARLLLAALSTIAVSPSNAEATFV